MPTRLLAIARNAFTETIRQPVYGLILFVTAGMMFFCILFAAFTLDNDNMLLKEFGLSTLLMSGLFLASFSAGGILSREIQNRTVLSVISKPVSRATLILGKFIGLLAALAVAFYLSTLTLLFLVRHGVKEATGDPFDLPVIFASVAAVAIAVLVAAFVNYFYKKLFRTTAIAIAVFSMSAAALFCCFVDKEWKLQTVFGKGFIDLPVIAGAFLVFLAVMFMTAVALAASTRTGQVATLVICLIVLLMGMASDYMFGPATLHPDESPLTAAAYGVIPNLSVFWVAEAISAKREVSFMYLLTTAGYATLNTIAALCIAMALFQHREVG